MILTGFFTQNKRQQNYQDKDLTGPGWRQLEHILDEHILDSHTLSLAQSHNRQSGSEELGHSGKSVVPESRPGLSRPHSSTLNGPLPARCKLGLEPVPGCKASPQVINPALPIYWG